MGKVTKNLGVLSEQRKRHLQSLGRNGQRNRRQHQRGGVRERDGRVRVKKEGLVSTGQSYSQKRSEQESAHGLGSEEGHRGPQRGSLSVSSR